MSLVRFIAVAALAAAAARGPAGASNIFNNHCPISSDSQWEQFKLDYGAAPCFRTTEMDDFRRSIYHASAQYRDCVRTYDIDKTLPVTWMTAHELICGVRSAKHRAFHSRRGEDFCASVTYDDKGCVRSRVELYNLYKKKFGKCIRTPLEDSLRYTLFIYRMRQLECENMDVEDSYAAKLNDKSDLTIGERVCMRRLNSTQACLVTLDPNWIEELKKPIGWDWYKRYPSGYARW